jgi:hypothetical protein
VVPFTYKTKETHVYYQFGYLDTIFEYFYYDIIKHKHYRNQCQGPLLILYWY